MAPATSPGATTTSMSIIGLAASPGMTGLWQVSGRSELTFDEMVLLDIYYVENWSLALDLGIFLRSIPAVLRGKGAY